MAASAVNSQTLEITDVLGTPGGTGVVDVNYTTGGNLASISVQLQWDPALLTPQTDAAANPNVNGCVANTPPSHTGTFTACNNPSPGNIALTVSDQFLGTVLPTLTPLGTITFDVAGSVPPGTNIPVTVTFLSALDNGGNALTAGDVTLVDGSVTTEAPAGVGFYASTPAPGEDLDLGAAVVGGTTAPAVNLNVQNPSPDTDFDVTAINSGDTQLNTPAGATVTAGGNVDFPFDCSPTARGDQGGAFQVEHDAGNGAGSPVDYTFSCAGLSPNVAVSTTTVTLNGVIGQANPSGSFNVTNAQDGFTSDALNATLSEGGTGEINVTDGLIDPTIAIDEVDAVTVDCSTAAPGMFSEVLSLEYDDPVTGGVALIEVTVNCEIINEIPEYESVPAPGVTLVLGQVLNGDTSPAFPIDIGNTDTDTVPNGTLEITGATITGPDAGVFMLATTPTGTMIPADTGPDGVADAEVTCTPTDGFSTFTATLNISSNDPDGDATYPLTCQGDNDVGLVSTPPPGDVNLGIIGPGMDADSTITISNTGTTDSVSLSCTGPTGDPEITLVSPVSFPVSIAPGASTDIVLNCAPTAPGAFSATLSCDATVPGGTMIPLVYDLRCLGQAVEVPTLSRIGLLAMIMALMAVGFIGFRLRQN